MAQAPVAAQTSALPPVAQAQEAQQQIAELLRRYAHATDLIAADSAANEADVEATYRRIFTADAKIGVRGQMSVSGPAAWLELVKASTGALRGSQHMLGSQVVEVGRLPNAEGLGGEATITSYLQATRVGADGDVSRVLGTYLATASHSAESGWQIAELMLEVLALD
ncbi:MAG: nuclear transport factor 2 family protein [Acidobacteriota bacterium]|nr:nuclear transport factor 2 family protein [Acidobacteriota bacterium]